MISIIIFVNHKTFNIKVGLFMDQKCLTTTVEEEENDSCFISWTTLKENHTLVSLIAIDKLIFI